jgi:hypothetical protein
MPVKDAIPLTYAFRVSTIGCRGTDHFGFRSKFTFRRRSLMKRTSKGTLGLFIATFIATLLLTATASAQTQMPKPGPEHKKLDYFTGNWTCDGDMKSGPMGPGGKMTMTDDSKWMDGGYFVVIHSQFKSASMGDGNGIAFLGYDADEKKYTYNEFNSQGETVVSKGTVDGDAWTWIGDMKPSGKGRFSEKILSPTAYSFKFEMSSDGTNWTPVLDGKCAKSK